MFLDITSPALLVGYTHIICFEKLTKFLGWQPCEFRTTADVVALHLAALYIRTKHGEVRHVCVGLVTYREG